MPARHPGRAVSTPAKEWDDFFTDRQLAFMNDNVVESRGEVQWAVWSSVTRRNVNIVECHTQCICTKCRVYILVARNKSRFQTPNTRQQVLCHLAVCAMSHADIYVSTSRSKKKLADPWGISSTSSLSSWM